MDKLHISIAAETIFHLGPFGITNALLTSWIVVTGLCLFAVFVSKRLKKHPGNGQVLLEMLFDALSNLTKNVAAHRSVIFFPYIATFFLYILVSNWIGLIPGFGTILLTPAGTSEFNSQGKVPLLRAPTADINTTLALALFSVSIIQFYGLKTLGTSYLSKFFSFKSPVKTFVGILELISEFAKIISFAFRLFGNIFAGEVLLTVTAFLIPLVAPVPFYGLEVFVGFIQALVFSMLSLVFLNMATTPAEH